MNFNQINQEFREGEYIFKPITRNDRVLINQMFQDSEIRKYYIVPKEARQDYKQLVDYWLNDINNGAGTCWIIHKKGSGVFSSNKPCGFVAFEFRNSLENARISYAILPNFRRNGIATLAVGKIVEKLKGQGVKKVEADIDRDNLYSEKVVEKLGFTANKRQALVDPEMMREGEIRMRALWKKDLVDFNDSVLAGRIPIDASISQIVPFINKVVEEINSKGQHPNLLIRYFYLLGRIKYLEGNYEEAKEAFGQCNMITMNEGKPEIHENYYWFAKINEANGDNENAKMYYGFALEKYNPNPNYISRQEIEAELNKEPINYDDLDFYVIKRSDFNKLINNRTVFKVWEEESSSGNDFGFDFMSQFQERQKTGKYHFSFTTDVTEKLVGISDNETVYNITWELLREENHNGEKFLILCGWGDPMSTGTIGGLPQFNYYEIGVEKGVFVSLIANLMSNNPNFFSIDKMRNVIGLENFNL